jgi:hypothetical protein
MDNNPPETKDDIIHRLQKRLQAVELSYHDLLENFDVRVKLACKSEINKAKKLENQLKAIQKIIVGKQNGRDD